MTSIHELSHLFPNPRYPVIVEIDGNLVAAKSLRKLGEQLLHFDLVESQSYDAIDKTGESWALMVIENKAVLSPFTFTKQRSKLELIRSFNNRKNKPADEVEYSEKSLSSKRLDRIIAEIADRLIDAGKRKTSR